MKQMNPIESLKQVGGGNPHTEELAQFHNAAYGRIETEPDAATGLPAHDAVYSNGAGFSAIVTPGGVGGTTDFPQEVARLSGTVTSVEPPLNNVIPVPEDTETRKGSWSEMVKRGS